MPETPRAAGERANADFNNQLMAERRQSLGLPAQTEADIRAMELARMADEGPVPVSTYRPNAVKEYNLVGETAPRTTNTGPVTADIVRFQPPSRSYNLPSQGNMTGEQIANDLREKIAQLNAQRATNAAGHNERVAQLKAEIAQLSEQRAAANAAAQERTGERLAASFENNRAPSAGAAARNREMPELKFVEEPGNFNVSNTGRRMTEGEIAQMRANTPRLGEAGEWTGPQLGTTSFNRNNLPIMAGVGLGLGGLGYAALNMPRSQQGAPQQIPPQAPAQGAPPQNPPQQVPVQIPAGGPSAANPLPNPMADEIGRAHV